MPKFHDIRIKEYIFSPRFRNIDFRSFIDSAEDFIVSDNKEIESFEKAYFSWDLHKDIDTSIDYPSQEFVFAMESKLLEVLTRMESQGFNLDAAKLKNTGEEILSKIDSLEKEIYEVVGERFNLNSPKQLQVILFEKLKIPTTKSIKTGFSVDNEALEYIGQTNAVAYLILEHRGLRKLLTTYVEGLLKALNPLTKKIHTTFNQTQAVTGRLSSENPNLQNIPSGDGYSEMIKSCFVPSSPDYKIFVCDYSQVELRVLANLSQDQVLLDAFRKGEDIHSRTAKSLFGADTAITGELRRRAKTVNFGVIYGISGFGLSKQIGTTPGEAASYIEKFYETYTGVRKYYDGILEKARETGYVETFFGRRRYIGGINDANRIMRGQAEREAINMPIQGTSADIIKLAMIEIDEYFRSNNCKSKMILQVHDELVFEIHKDEMHLQEKIRHIMENVVDFEAKLLVDSGIGDNWKEAKK